MTIHNLVILNAEIGEAPEILNVIPFSSKDKAKKVLIDKYNELLEPVEDIVSEATCDDDWFYMADEDGNFTKGEIITEELQ